MKTKFDIYMEAAALERMDEGVLDKMKDAATAVGEKTAGLFSQKAKYEAQGAQIARSWSEKERLSDLIGSYLAFIKHLDEGQLDEILPKKFEKLNLKDEYKRALLKKIVEVYKIRILTKLKEAEELSRQPLKKGQMKTSEILHSNGATYEAWSKLVKAYSIHPPDMYGGKKLTQELEKYIKDLETRIKREK